MDPSESWDDGVEAGGSNTVVPAKAGTHTRALVTFASLRIYALPNHETRKNHAPPIKTPPAMAIHQTADRGSLIRFHANGD